MRLPVVPPLSAESHRQVKHAPKLGTYRLDHDSVSREHAGTARSTLAEAGAEQRPWHGPEWPGQGPRHGRGKGRAMPVARSRVAETGVAQWPRLWQSGGPWLGQSGGLGRACAAQRLSRTRAGRAMPSALTAFRHCCQVAVVILTMLMLTGGRGAFLRRHLVPHGPRYVSKLVR